MYLNCFTILFRLKYSAWAGIIPVDFFALPLFLYIEAQSVKLPLEISLNLVNYY